MYCNHDVTDVKEIRRTAEVSNRLSKKVQSEPAREQSEQAPEQSEQARERRLRRAKQDEERDLSRSAKE
eukprot:3969084-Pleurochrysis_carterae.AAC.2